MPTEALIDGWAPIIRNWAESALLKDRTDAFRRSHELWQDRSAASPVGSDETYSAAQREVDLSVSKQCFEGLAAVREKNPAFFEAFDYEWAFDITNYLTPIKGGTRVESQSLRAQVLLLQAFATAWGINDQQASPLSFENICARQVTDLDPVPRSVLDGKYRYVIVSDEFRMQQLKLLGGLRSLSGSSRADDPAAAMERLCSPHTPEEFTDLPSIVLPRRLARVFRVPKKPWDLALLCMAEQKVEEVIPEFNDLSRDVFPPQRGSVELHLLDIVTPFFLYHEVAHLLLNHSSNRSIEKEMQADGLAWALFYGSRGWRDTADEVFGFSEVGSTLLGPLFFLWVAKCFTRLEVLTASETGRAAAKPFLEEIDLRRQNLGVRIQTTVAFAEKQMPGALPSQDLQRLEMLMATLTSAASSFESHTLWDDIVALSSKTLKAWSETL